MIRRYGAVWLEDAYQITVLDTPELSIRMQRPPQLPFDLLDGIFRLRGHFHRTNVDRYYILGGYTKSKTSYEVVTEILEGLHSNFYTLNDLDTVIKLFAEFLRQNVVIEMRVLSYKLYLLDHRSGMTTSHDE